MTLDQAKEKAAECFAVNPEHEQYHVTNDGMCYTEKDKAVRHCRDLNDYEIHTVNRSDVKVEVIDPAMIVDRPSYNDRLKLIKAAETVERVKEIVGDDDGTGINNAAAKRIAEIEEAKKAADSNA